MFLIPFTTVILWTCCDLCLSIRVPTHWTESDSVEVKSESLQDDVEYIKPENDPINENTQRKPIPTEYFEYTAKKPQYAADIAAFHGVKSPGDYYKSYAIQPYTEVKKPVLGKHRIYDSDRVVYTPYQQYAQHQDVSSHAFPIISSYDVYHPYKSEEPALQELYKDPVLNKIKNELSHLKYDEPKPTDISKDEYLENIDGTDKKIFSQKHEPAPYEVYKPQNKPLYYQMPVQYNPRHHHLNNRIKHPMNQNFVKIKPMHYMPLQHHLQKLRQQHFNKYNDEHNEYPQLPVKENYEGLPEGYDIYQRGIANYDKLRNGVDETIAKSVRNNRPFMHQNYELEDKNKSQKHKLEEESDEEEFVPVKNYAQVRRTETTKHLPRLAAMRDASNYDEYKNAPRLREAVKSTKAQTVYSEEGYEDSAYDHAGEQKHASDHEDHNGYLKENEESNGKFKTPSESTSYDNAIGSLYGDEKLHGKKWDDDTENREQLNSSENYDEDEYDKSVETETFASTPKEEFSEPYTERYKREHDQHLLANDSNISSYEEDNTSNKSSDNPINSNNETDLHGVNKREVKFEIPRINFNDSFFTEHHNVFNLANQKNNKSKENFRDKYPYYFENIKNIPRNSPLRYAENLKLIPKKTNGGSEFYNSRFLECPDVDDSVDPIPESIKMNGTNKDDNNSEESQKRKKRDTEPDENSDKSRLKGLGDKIDCFKVKYFGENPLDSPFFKEDLIAQPDPLKIPKLSSFKIKQNLDIKPILNNKTRETNNLSQKIITENENNLLNLLKKLNADIPNISTPMLQTFTRNESKPYFGTQKVDDIYGNLKNKSFQNMSSKKIDEKMTTLDDVDVTSLKNKSRTKRGVPFIYEPYKIIRDNQAQDTKKITTSSNVSPLIKQLQLSKTINKGYVDDHHEKHNKRADTEESRDSDFIDVNTDPRRGEPRYEMKQHNHRPHYLPTENKLALSIDDYNSRSKIIKNTIKPDNYKHNHQGESPRLASNETFFDISEFIPQQFEILKTAGSRKVSKVLRTTTPIPVKDTSIRKKNEEISTEANDDYEEESIEKITTEKPIFRRKTRISLAMATTEANKQKHVHTEKQIPKLQLVTRFRQPHIKMDKETTDVTPIKHEKSEELPKYREKSKKSSKSTLVTDTQRYGEDDNDMRKDEIDAMIGIKEDMDKYVPRYEKEIEKQDETVNEAPLSEEISPENISSEEYSDEESQSDDEYEDAEEKEESNEEYNKESDEIENEDDNIPEENKKEVELTTENSKSSTAPTTESPITNASPRTLKPDRKPLVVRKKIEIHKETPVNNSSPHVSQFKQDIKEIEIIKEMPNKNRKNLEALELYRDEQLPKKVNKLEDVEIFEEKLDLKKGPKHGGNYRVEEPLTKEHIKSTPQSASQSARKVLTVNNDADTSESESKKLIERNRENIRRNHGDIVLMITSKPSSDESGKLINIPSYKEKSSKNLRNLEQLQKAKTRNGNVRSAKLTELEDESEDDDSSEIYNDNNSYNKHLNSRKPLHGGNYRNSRLTKAEENQDEIVDKSLKAKSERSRNNRKSSADLLNSFVQAAPILTTTPLYILDPSKRMYFYVD